MIYGVILAGGRGERFWPLSRYENPKQLLKLTSSKTMIEETVDRFEGFIPRDKVMIVTGDHLKDKILGAVPSLNENNLLLEPEGKNTCLAIGLTAMHVKEEDPDGVMVVLSSDHLIHPRERLISILRAGTEVASEGDYLITIGVVPSRAETAYGYIELDEEFAFREGITFYGIKQFKEKPVPTKAQEYYLDRKHLWNSGMFIWRADAILKAIEKHVPDMYNCLLDYRNFIKNKETENARVTLYKNCASISIDFAVLEKASNVLTIRGDIKWDDVGSWLAMDRIHGRDRESNVKLGDVIAENSYENIVVNDADGVIACLGVSDLVIVRTGEIVMVAHKTRVADVKNLLATLGGDQKYEKYL
jgi:mannose-1-phosphate guanylyltransferase